MDGIEVRRLGPDRVDDFLSFFDRDAFTDNAWWAGCYCNFYESLSHPATNPDPTTPAFEPFRAGNRAEKARRIGAGGASGFLAYRDGRVVGWLNAQPKAAYANPRGFAPAFADAPEDAGMVMCFVVAPAARGGGVGTALLRAACEAFTADGLRYAQGFVRDPAAPLPAWLTPAMGSYHGTRSMFEQNGFTKVGELGSFAVMRKEL